MTLPQVRPERTGWRDESLSERHRRWGWDCPATDLDFLFLEYDKGKSVAIVEYKHENAKPQYASHPTYQALIDLGTRADIPVFACRYASKFEWFKVRGLNEKARTFLPQNEQMTEREYVAFLYRLRGYEPSDELLNGLEVEL